MTTSRLDLVLAARYPDFTRSRLKGLVDAGFVLVNGVTADKPGMKVRDTDEIEVEFPPPVPAEPEPEPIPLAVVYEDDDLFASIASGSYRFDAMFVAPCSTSSLAKISNGLADTLITRAAAVALKESRKLVLVVRETPKSAIVLENELRLARCGVCILDANPGFYSKPQTVDDIIDFIVGRCLDQLGIEHRLYKKWE